MLVGSAGFAGGLTLAACRIGAFHCEDVDDCGSDGTCEASGFCSFPDGACPSGQRYGEHAGDGLAGACVDELGTSSGPDTTQGSAVSSTTSITTSSVDTGDDTATTTPVTATSTSAESSTAGDEVGPESSDDGSSSESGDPIDPDLVAWYRFENPDGIGADSGPNGLHGHCEDGQCPVQIEGVVGAAAQFDGIDDYIHVADAAPFYTIDGWTVALWMRFDLIDEGHLRMAISRQYGQSFGNTYEVYLHDWIGDGPVLLYLGIASLSTDDRIEAELPVGVGEWMHVVGTWDGALGSLYLDGQLVGELPMEVSMFDQHDLLIGADQNEGPATSFWPGAVDEVRIYDRALTADEVVTLWDTELQ